MLFITVNAVGAWLLYETCIGIWVVLTNRESAYVPPTLVYSQAREKHLDWRDSFEGQN